MTKPVQRWDAPRGTTLAGNNESGELVMFDDHQIVVDALLAQNKHDDEADTLCRNLLCEERDAAENKAASLILLIREIDGWIKNWSPSFTEEEEWQEVKTHIDSALL